MNAFGIDFPEAGCDPRLSMVSRTSTPEASASPPWGQSSSSTISPSPWIGLTATVTGVCGRDTVSFGILQSDYTTSTFKQGYQHLR